MPAEEVDLEGQAENPAEAELARGTDESGDDPVADAQPPAGGIDGDGADLGEILPEHVKRSAADDRPVLSVATQNSWMSS